MNKKKKLIFLCQQIQADENRVQYNRACFLAENYSLYVIANKNVCRDLADKAHRVYSFSNHHKTGMYLNPFRILWVIFKIRLKDKRVRRIYSTYETRSIILAFIAKTVFRLNMVTDLWDDPEKALMIAKKGEGDQKRGMLLLKTIEFSIAKRLVKRSDKIIIGLVPEPIVRKYSLSESNWLPVTNGINLNFKPERKNIQKESGQFTVFYCGSVDKTRLEGLAECMFQVAKSIKEIRIVIIGAEEPGGYKWLERSFGKLQSCINLDIRGHRLYREVLQGVSDSDVCICPYPDKLDIGPTYPVKIFDYMYMGKPVVASRLPGISRIIEHGTDGLLFEPGDYAEMAEHIVRLHNDETLRKRVSYFAEKNVIKFGWDNIHLKILDFLEDE